MGKNIARSLPKAAIREIFELRAKGYSYRIIADRFGVSDNFVHSVINRQTRSDVPMDAGIVTVAQSIQKATKRMPYNRKKDEPEQAPVEESKVFPNQLEWITALTDFIEARHEQVEAQKKVAQARERCMAHGMSAAYLEITADEIAGLNGSQPTGPENRELPL